MNSTDLNPLVKHYLRQLRRVARCLPRERRADLIAEIEAHLRESIASGASDLEVRLVLDRLGTPEQIVAADLPAVQPLAPAGGGREIGAVVLLLLGGFIFWIGWFVGLFLLWTSKLWTVADKLIGTLFIPGGLLIPALVLGLGTGGTVSCVHARSGPIHCSVSAGPDPLELLAFLALILVPIGTAIYLGWRARSARRLFRVRAAAYS